MAVHHNIKIAKTMQIFVSIKKILELELSGRFLQPATANLPVMESGVL